MSPLTTENETSTSCHTEEDEGQVHERQEKTHDLNVRSVKEVMKNQLETKLEKKDGDTEQSKSNEKKESTGEFDKGVSTNTQKSTNFQDVLKLVSAHTTEARGGEEDSHDGDEWSGLWDSKTKKTSHSPSENSIKRKASAAELHTSVGSLSSLSKPSNRSTKIGIMDDLRKELGHHRRRVPVGVQCAKRQKTNDGEVSDLIARMSSSNLLRTSPSGRLIGESARQRIAGAMNATFDNVQTPASRFDSKINLANIGSRSQLAPFGSKAHLEGLNSKAILSGFGSRAALNGSSSNARFDLVRPSSSSDRSGGSSNARFDLVRPGGSMESNTNRLSSKANLLGSSKHDLVGLSNSCNLAR